MVELTRYDQCRSMNLIESLHDQRIERVKGSGICFPPRLMGKCDPAHLGGTLADTWIDLVRLAKRTVNPNAVLQFRCKRQITLFDCRHHLQYRIEHLRLLGLVERISTGQDATGRGRFMYRLSRSYRMYIGQGPQPA